MRRRATLAVPRTCGDVPAGNQLSQLRLDCSPHPWGCSHPQRHPARTGRLLPAPAGMFPRSTGSATPRPLASCIREECPRTSVRRSATRSVPRARGDVPVFVNYVWPANGCPPRPRGCSPARAGLGPVLGLLPAPAGMSPARASTPSPRCAVPDTCGAVSNVALMLYVLDVCCPPPRGCSCCTLSIVDGAVCSRRPRGCSLPVGHAAVGPILLPAPAGMFPRCQAQSPAKGSAPRTAGMLPATTSASRATCRASRVRGDVPPFSAPGASPKSCFPHSRGCSRIRLSAGDLCDLLPAPAGMFPPESPSSGSRTIAPGIRGDVPDGEARLYLRDGCSLHLRGCSLHPAGHRRYGRAAPCIRRGCSP